MYIIFPPNRLLDDKVFSCFRTSSSIVGHCKIERHESGFGFAEPYYIHETLKDLVLHYQEISLAEHNDDLDLTLMYPVKQPKAPREVRPARPARDNYEMHSVGNYEMHVPNNNQEFATYVEYNR